MQAKSDRREIGSGQQLYEGVKQNAEIKAEMKIFANTSGRVPTSIL